MNTNNQNQESPVIAQEKNAIAVNGLPAEEVFKVGVSKIGYAYIYEKDGTYPPSDADLIFRYDEAGNQILREMLVQ
ncbi:hypothetical protein BAX94_15355 [Elizabethkingia meningoseptica]|uniref:Uncharacterized protein n=1 Tax=Elizabethkingia meningoseptica TaxID=238 RepID=A0A1T3IRG6_ELIME|nr:MULTISPECIES: hypothetical protein [Elizabethkingia]AQX12262.1 hypothetical protein BBD35_07680 [Elizabethkingia meningoseptica]MBG0513783.1 hypothetical protein [Elizabethkingia meningoseptica]MDE5436228.1 hypothetical protein [Elizabethkingia meningoseptica]MDE5449159.1 hypothetical protein [Elizabethkingia meningoseptica]MDE5473238.1 hypothetical protein [Elizabethkingia meningoseptica]